MLQTLTFACVLALMGVILVGIAQEAQARRDCRNRPPPDA